MTLSIIPNDILSILPFAVLTAWGCLLLIVDLFIPTERKGITALLTAVGLAGTLVITLLLSSRAPVTGFHGMVVLDGFAIFLSALFLTSGLAAILVAFDYLKRSGIERGEYYALLLFSISGMLLMAEAADLIIVFLALELLSIPLYIMAGFARPRLASEEAAIKYFLLGAFATGFVVYGIALIYGATRTTDLKEIVAAIAAAPGIPFGLVIGAALLLVGLGFKVAAVPFHMWTPDVYQGSPSSVTAFMAVGAKAGGFAALLRIFVLAFPAISADLTPVLWMLSALTMILGNVVAIAQNNIKRMLAYSSIAQAGYILMALVPYGNGQVARSAVASALFYLLAYAFTSFAAWSVVIALEQAEDKGLSIDDYAGLGRKYPLLAASMTIAMLSFTGVPPTLGFVGKFFLFGSVIQGGYYGLALIGVLTSLVSAYYYLRVVVVMYMRDGEPVVRRERWLYLTAVVAGAATLFFGIFSAPLITWATQAVLSISL